MGIFTRDESELLSYDANAFWYFAGTMLTVIVIPWTVLLARCLFRPRVTPEDDYETRGPGKVADAIVKHCATKDMQTKRNHAIELTRSWKYRLSGGVWFQIAVVICLWVMLAMVAWNIHGVTDELRSFDPYAILGIDVDASPKDIKKAYRTKSLEHHPDKDKDNPFATVLFQQVAKAYAALTDDAARENYAKYGNPDGPGQMKVGVALHPVVLGTPENQRMTLCMFFSVLLIVPFSIVCCCLRGQRLSFRGVSHETLRVLTACIDEELSPEDGPSLLAASVEARRAMSADLSHIGRAIIELRPQPLDKGLPVVVFDGPVRKKGVKMIARGQVARMLDDKRAVEVETQEMKPGIKEPKVQLREFPKEHVEVCEPNISCMFSDPPLRRNCMLIWAHLWRLQMSPAAQAELTTVLRHSVEIGRAMIGISANHPAHDTSSFLNIVRSLIEFRQCLVQALDIGSSPLLQLPHASEIIKPKTLENAPKFKEIVSGNAGEFLDRLKLTPEQRLDVDAFCRHAPLVELSCSVEVTDEEEIAQGDIAKLTVTLTRTNLKEGEAVGPVHAPFFPMPKFEEWWLLLYDERDRRLVTVASINGTGREEKETIPFMVPRSGKFRWTVHAVCDSYVGLDVSHTFNFTALKSSEVKKEIFVHPHDRNIRTFFEEMMEGLNPPVEESDSDSEEEEAGQSSAKLKDNGLSSSAQGVGAVEVSPFEEKQAVQRGDDYSDSDCEGGDANHLEPEGTFFEVASSSGVFIYKEPRSEAELRIGSASCGTIWRVHLSAEGACPPGWAEIAPGAWFNYADTEASMKKELQTLNQRSLQRWATEFGVSEEEIDKAAEKKDPKAAIVALILSKQTFDAEGTESTSSSTNGNRRTEPSIKQLGGLLDQPLGSIVRTRIPLHLLKRWMKKSTKEVTLEDMEAVVRIEESRIRSLLDELLRRRLGDERMDTLLIQTEVKIRKNKQRIMKARGFFCSAVGSQSRILWHVNPSGQVRGMHPDGSKIRDKVTVSAENEIQIGPFTLDEKRTCSCIHWIRKDDPKTQWVWSRDRTLHARMRMNW